MMKSITLICGLFLLLAAVINDVQSTCVFESDFGFKLNCAFKKSGLFRVRNLGGLKAHASLGFSLGDELGFEQSLTNLDPSRRRSVSVKNGAPPNLVASASAANTKQEKRGKQNRIMMRPVVQPATRPNQAAMDRLSSLHRRVSSTMQPIIVQAPVQTPAVRVPGVTMAKPMPMGVPPFRPLPPKEDTLKVLPITSPTRKHYTPLQVPESKGPGLAYQSEILYPQSQNQISKMVAQMTAVQYAQPMLKITPTPVVVHSAIYTAPLNHVNQFVPMPIASPPAQALTIIQPPAFKDTPTNGYIQSNSVQKTNPPISNFIDPVPHNVHNIASNYVYNTKKVDDYNTITGYGDDTTLKFTKEDINAKIAEIAKAGNISMEAVEAAISLRQQQLLNKYASIPSPKTTSSTTTTTTSTTEPPVVFEPEPEILVAATPQKPQRSPTSGKVMNAPKEYYPVGYEKNFDDHFQTKVDLPDTNFHCGDQKYFPGLYGDESLGCMVFHVCALTDDGLVMKSFLCPESTLFDQTILKCNWWFYVDCKNTRKLYDTNIPVSKSYQLMKALTFFSSYKKEMQDDGRPTNPEDVEGIKEAITILENQESSKQSQSNSGPEALHIITPQPLIDERHNQNVEYSTEPSPVYRSNRNLKNSTTFDSVNKNFTNSQEVVSPEYRLVTVNADMNFNNSTAVLNSAETNNTSADKDRKHRRRMTLRSSSDTRKSIKATTTTSTPKSTINIHTELNTPSVEIIKQEIQPIENFSETRQEKLTDQLDNLKEYDDNPSPVRRFYRSSAESATEKAEREIAVVNNERVFIVRPTATSRLVGHNPTQVAAIDRLDAAVLGKPVLRFKKDAVTIVTPHRSILLNRAT